jgi:hypothetical protein
VETNVNLVPAGSALTGIIDYVVIVLSVSKKYYLKQFGLEVSFPGYEVVDTRRARGPWL